MVPKLLVGLETWGHKLAASLSELVLQNKVGASGAEFGAEKIIWAPVVPEKQIGRHWCRIWCRKILVPNLVPNSCPNWCRIWCRIGAELFLGRKWCRIKLGAAPGARIPSFDTDLHL